MHIVTKQQIITAYKDFKRTAYSESKWLNFKCQNSQILLDK